MTLTKIKIKLNTKNIYLIRHGQTDFNKRGVVQGKGIDAPLNAEGQDQANKFYLKYQGVSFSKIYISSLVRTYQTVKGFIDLGIPVQKLAGLDEIDWGVWEGRSISEDGKMYYSDTVKRWSNGETSYAIEGGESPKMVQERQRKALEEIMGQTGEELILICMHGRAMRILLPTLLNVPLRNMDDYEHENTSLYQLNYDGNKFSIVNHNDTSHLV